VSDNRNDADQIEPSGFPQRQRNPTITTLFPARGQPHGLYPARDGMMRVMVGFIAGQAEGLRLRRQRPDQETISPAIGRLDGIYEMRDGSYLATDWNSGSLFQWLQNGEIRKLADGFKGRPTSA
jgi:hypothetical protein